MKTTDIRIDKAFIGSCTNSRIEDLRAAAAIVRGRRKADHVEALIVPGSGLIKRQAEQEGLDRIFRDAGFEWREAGCSMCPAMNDDRLKPAGTGRRREDLSSPSCSAWPRPNSASTAPLALRRPRDGSGRPPSSSMRLLVRQAMKALSMRTLIAGETEDHVGQARPRVVGLLRPDRAPGARWLTSCLS